MEDTPAPPQHGQDLCLTCGICCDGSYFETVPVDDLDKLLHFKAAGIEFNIGKNAETGEPYFKLPCPAHCKGSCSIYADRPSVCRDYKCILLKAYEKGEMDFSAASGIVQKTKDRKQAILKRVAELGLPLESTNVVFGLYDGIFDFFKNLEEGERKKQCGELVLQIAALRLFISTHFKNFETMARAPEKTDAQ